MATDEAPEDERVMPALLALMDAAASFIAEMERASEYIVGTFNVVRCNHGIVYSPTLFKQSATTRLNS